MQCWVNPTPSAGNKPRKVYDKVCPHVQAGGCLVKVKGLCEKCYTATISKKRKRKPNLSTSSAIMAFYSKELPGKITKHLYLQSKHAAMDEIFLFHATISAFIQHTFQYAYI